ncbi:MAG: Bax inhibitor-1/YccA family protein [Deltaproteobacteria bacterium]|jgi:FtsH-binding integral membrane protein|nr:Bax inhibitor-1/YccA family protein [Deltaproteobacteria bacterium]
MQDFTQPPQNYGGQSQYGGPPLYGGQPSPATLAASAEALFFQKVYVWMCGALLVSGLTGYLLSHSSGWLRLITSSGAVPMFIIILQLGLVLLISFMFRSLSSFAVKCLYMAYAVSIGFTFSIVLLVYSPGIIFKAFVSTAGVYGAMAVYGLVTKRSLQSWGSFLFMGLVGIILASIVNFFARSDAMDFVICVAGVLVFAGLTAYDHQKLRVIHAGGFGNVEEQEKSVCMGALQLYLDFINIFFFLLRLFGRGGD